jgi:hypothetical protein
MLDRDLKQRRARALVSLDELFAMRLSKTASKGQQTAWARHEGDKFRLEWTYFMRLRSRWLNNYIVMSLWDSNRAEEPAQAARN